MRILIIALMLSCGLSSLGQGQSLGELLRAVQERKRLICEREQRVYPALKIQANNNNGYSGTDGLDDYDEYVDWAEVIAEPLELIQWVGLEGSPDPTDMQVDALSQENRLKLLKQAHEELQYLQARGYGGHISGGTYGFIDKRGVKNGVGRPRLIQNKSLGPVNAENFEAYLRLLSRRVENMRLLEWYAVNHGDWYYGEQTSSGIPSPPIPANPTTTQGGTGWEVSRSQNESAKLDGSGTYNSEDSEIKITRSLATSFPSSSIGPSFVGGKFRIYAYSWPFDSITNYSLAQPKEGEPPLGPARQLHSETALSGSSTSISASSLASGGLGSVSFRGSWLLNDGSARLAPFLNDQPNLGYGSGGSGVGAPDFTPGDEYDLSREPRESRTFGKFGLFYETGEIHATGNYLFDAEFETILPPQTPPAVNSRAFCLESDFEKGRLRIIVSEGECDLVLKFPYAVVDVNSYPWGPYVFISGSLFPSGALYSRNILHAEGDGDWDAVYTGKAADREPAVTWPYGTVQAYKRWDSYWSYFRESWQPVLCQLVSKKAGLNITQENAFKYRIDCYLGHQIGEKNLSTGRYSFTGSPVKSFTVENPDQDLAVRGKLKITSVEDGVIAISLNQTMATLYGYNVLDQSTWHLTQTKDEAVVMEETLVKEQQQTSFVPSFFRPCKTTRDIALAGVSQPQVIKSYFEDSEPSYPSFPKYDKIEEKVGSETRTTDFSYDSNGDLTGITYDGPEPYTATYGTGEQITSYEQGDNKTTWGYDGDLITIESFYKNALVSRSWKEYHGPYEIHEIVATDLSETDPSGSSNLRTICYLKSGTDSVNPWALSAVRYPDGTVTKFSYAWAQSDTKFITIADSGLGVGSSGVPSGVSAGKRVILTQHKDGGVLSESVEDIESGVILASRTGSDPLPGFGYPRSWTNLDGSTGSAEYTALGEQASVTDAWGKKTTIVRDGLKRLASLTRDGGKSMALSYPDFKAVATFGGDANRKVELELNAFGDFASSTRQWDHLQHVVTKETGGYESAVSDALGNRTQTAESDLAGVLKNSGGGNAGQAFDHAVAASTIPGAGIGGTRVTSTHKPGGTASGITLVEYYDGAGRLRRREQPGADGTTAVTVFGYVGAQLKTVTDPDGIKTLYEYDSQGQLSGVVRDMNGNGVVDDGVDRIIRVASAGVDGKWQTTTSEYNGGSARIVARGIIDPAGRTAEIYPDNDANRKVTVTATAVASGTRSITAGSAALGESIQTITDGVLAGSSLSSGGMTRETVITSDTWGQPTKVEGSGTGPATEVNLNPQAGKITSTQLGTRTTSYSYANRVGGGIDLTATQGSVDQTGSWSPKNEYLGAGGDDRIDFSLSETSYNGGHMGRTLTLGGNETGFQTNLGGGDHTKTYPDESTEYQTYTAGGVLLTKTNVRGQTTTYAHNDAGELTVLDLPEYDPWTLARRQDGRIESITDSSGERVLGYDSAGRLHTITYQAGSPLAGKIITYDYDTAGRLSGVKVTGGDEITYGYSGLQMTGVTNTTANRTAAFTGDALPNGIPRVMSNGSLTVTKTVNANGELDHIANSAAGNTLDFAYEYDGNGKRSKITFDGNKTWDLTYDGDGQLDSAVKKDAGVSQFDYAYAVNAVGNPTGRSLNGVTSVFTGGAAGLNQVAGRTNPNRSVTVEGSVAPAGTPPSTTPAATVKINGVSETVQSDGSFSKVLSGLGDLGTWVNVTVEGRIAGAGDENHDAVAEQTQALWLPPLNESLGHDADGNRDEDSKFDYEWDSQNRLKSVTEKVASASGGLLKVEFDYDSQGRRFRKKVSRGGTVQSETLFVHDGWRLLLEEKRNGSGTLELTRSYTWGPDLSGSLDGAGGVGGLLEMRETKGSATTRSLPCYDGRGNIVGLVDATSGAKVAEYDYGMFGEPLSATGTRADSCPLRFSTKYYDEETGLYYFGCRYFDPQTRQWMSRDPLGEAGGVNLYAYCSNDPVNNVDPVGLSIDDPYDNTLINLSLQLRDSPYIGDRFLGMGFGLAGLPQAVFDSVIYSGRTGAPKAIGEARERLRLQEANGMGWPKVIFSRVGLSASEAMLAPLMLPTNLDRIPGAVIDLPGHALNDLNSFADAPSFNGFYNLGEDATAVFGLAKLAQSSTRLVGPVRNMLPEVTISPNPNLSFNSFPGDMPFKITIGPTNIAPRSFAYWEKPPQFYIRDGVRRAVAARESGEAFIFARIVREGQADQLVKVHLDQLNSPKASILLDPRFNPVLRPNYLPIEIEPLGLPLQMPTVPILEIR